MTRKSCQGCIYRFQPSSEGGLCNYLSATGQQRGCSAENCDKKIIAPKKEPKEKGWYEVWKRI